MTLRILNSGGVGAEHSGPGVTQQSDSVTAGGRTKTLHFIPRLFAKMLPFYSAVVDAKMSMQPASELRVYVKECLRLAWCVMFLWTYVGICFFRGN